MFIIRKSVQVALRYFIMRVSSIVADRMCVNQTSSLFADRMCLNQTHPVSDYTAYMHDKIPSGCLYRLPDDEHLVVRNMSKTI